MSYFAAPDLRPFAPDRFPVWIFHGANFGDSDWLDAQMSLVDYGHRSVPNVFLTAPLQTTNAKTGTGPWNAAHFASAQYDKLVAQYIAAVDRQPRRACGYWVGFTHCGG